MVAMSPPSNGSRTAFKGSNNNSNGDCIVTFAQVVLFFGVLLPLLLLTVHLSVFYSLHEKIHNDYKQQVIDEAMPIINKEGKPMPPPSPQELEFYRHHYNQIKTLANMSTVLVWNTRSRTDAFGPWFRHFNNGNVYKANGIDLDEIDLKASRYIFWGSICFAARVFEKHRSQPNAEPLQHVLFFRMNENWGGFSETIPGKTAEWITDLVGNEWKKQRCQNETVFNYLDHPDTLVAMTTQFQIFDHPKVHSLPLGVKSLGQAQFLIDHLLDNHEQPRTQLVMVNSKPRVMRQAAINAVVQNFHGTVQNTFGVGDDPAKNYYQEMLRSKFILSPGGLGFDCYRHWEALYMGTIPILESLNRTDGWFRTFDHLPVVWIDSYNNLTPEFLEAEYQRIIHQPKSYWKYEKLTQQWWADFIQSKVPEEIRNKPYPGRES